MSSDARSGSAAPPVDTLPVTERTIRLKSEFAARYECEPDFYVRVPGRVNLIGEHIDYCGYGVCPMALEQDVMLAISCDSNPILRLANVQPAYKSFDCSMEEIKIDVTAGAPEWYQYFLCGVRGIVEILPQAVQVKGLSVMVSGNVPQSAGLSSSSALVSAAALATSYAHKLSLSKEKIASICAECERYIGTQGGGMDQAIAFLATEGCAKLINFNPLRSEDVTLPQGAVFVVAHSLTRLNKAATSDYNCRVIECRLAAQLLAKKSGLEWRKVKKLGELQVDLNIDLDAMISLVISDLHETPYTKEELLKEFAINEQEMLQVSLTENTKHINSFKLQQRALHVFQEALRVQKFHETCTLNVDGGEDNALSALGKLMSQSHVSLRDLYECSHPQLDRLVEISGEIALGTRLTGAGWGGCAVALLSPNNVEKYIALIKEKFYKPLQATDLDSLIFSTAPNAGANIYLPN